MNFLIGQAVLGQLRFKDGKMSQKKRPYLIVNVNDEFIEVITVSTIRKKERKLAFGTNLRLKKYNPPFCYPSFVKLDSRIKVPKEKWNELKIVSNGQTLDQDELKEIIRRII